MKFTKGNAYCTSGYNYKDVRYKYIYNYEKDKVMIESIPGDKLDRKYIELRQEFLEIDDYLNQYIVLSEDDDCENNMISFFEGYNSDVDYADNIKKFIDDRNIFILELLFVEDYMKIMRVARRNFKIEDKPLVFTKYIINDEPKRGFFGSLFGKNSDKKILSNREDSLWGLSKEDKRIAREERMSDSDYVEAEEYDDDELVKDDWDR